MTIKPQNTLLTCKGMSKLIDAIALPIMKSTMNIVKNELNEVNDNMVNNIEKRSIPRPEELGLLDKQASFLTFKLTLFNLI